MRKNCTITRKRQISMYLVCCNLLLGGLLLLLWWQSATQSNRVTSRAAPPWGNLRPPNRIRNNWVCCCRERRKCQSPYDATVILPSDKIEKENCDKQEFVGVERAQLHNTRSVPDSCSTSPTQTDCIKCGTGFSHDIPIEPVEGDYHKHKLHCH